jgi:hypothetical protein
VRIAAKLDRLERLVRVSEFDLTVKAIGKVMDECAAEATGGGPTRGKESLMDILGGKYEKHD